jgi:hypothetical protein
MQILLLVKIVSIANLNFQDTKLAILPHELKAYYPTSLLAIQ